VIDLIHELVRGISWSVIGFMAGYLAAYYKLRLDVIDREVTVIERKLDADDDDENHDDVVERCDEKRRHRSGVPRWLGTLLIVLSVFTVAQGWYFSHEDRLHTQCQAAFNDDFVNVLTLRNQWALEDRNALTLMIQTVLAGATPAIRRDAIVAYISTIKKNDELRAKNPLPDLTQRHC
jgi:hypothetical protein